MSEAVQLAPGSALLAGPLVVSDGSAFPGSTSTVPLALQPPQKPYAVTSGVLLFTISSLSFVVIPAVGAVGPVTQAHTVYVRSLGPIQLRLTYLGDASPGITYLSGLAVIEVDPSRAVTKIEALGAGQLEVFAAGNL